MKISQITEKTEDLKQPYDKYDYNNDIQNTFNFPVHRNVIIYKIKNYTYNN